MLAKFKCRFFLILVATICSAALFLLALVLFAFYPTWAVESGEAKLVRSSVGPIWIVKGVQVYSGSYFPL